MPANRASLTTCALLALLFAACGSEQEGPPTVVRLAADPALSSKASLALTEIAEARGLTVEVAASDAADLVVSTAPSPEGAPFVIRRWVPVVALPNPAENVTSDQLRDAIAGRTADWASIRGDSAAMRVLLPDVPAPPIAQWWTDVVPSSKTASVADIIRTLQTDNDVIGLIPLSEVNASVRGLAAGGVDIVFGVGDPGAYALIERGSVQARTHKNKEFARTLSELSQQLAALLSAPPPDPIILRATGDIIPARCVYEKHLQYNDFAHAFRELGAWLAQADITVGSLDAAVSDAGVPFGCQETFSLLAPAASADGFALAGIDVMTVATNHVKDCGQAACADDAFFDTLANLRERNIQPVGGGADLAEARAPAFVTVKGVRFAFLGYDEIAPYYHAEPGLPGTAPLEEAYVREDIAAAAAQADVVVVEPQWGVEYTADPNEHQRGLARAAVGVGADLVIGNHPHWVEAAEVIGDAFVAYALGNFVFDQDWSTETQQGVVLEAAFHGPRLVGVRYFPVHIYDEHQPRFADPGEAAQILDRIWTASASLQ